MNKIIFRPATAKDAEAVEELTTQSIIASDPNKLDQEFAPDFPKIIADDLRTDLRKRRFIANVAIDAKSGRIIAYAGIMLRKRFRNRSQKLFKQIAKYPGRNYGHEDYIVTHPAYRRMGLATKLRKLNELAFKERFGMGEIFSRRAGQNLPRAALDRKTGYKEIVGVIGKPAEKYISKTGIIARKIILPGRRIH